ncbi:hypothetical protein V6N12_055266 [Hibiscus sabdariffa]|uniref:At4g15545-like C-terminal domain-containing protein n=1 Tax=Hibiscus sabdariffa TaxID=183260 RepID=A0ABR2AVA0_9ROSI
MFSFPRATAEDTSSTVAEEILSLIPTDTYEQLDLAPPWQSHPQCPRWSASTHSSNGLKGMGNTFDEATRHAGQRYSITPYIMPRLRPRDHSAVQTPQRSSASTSPRKPSYDGRTSLSSWYPSSQPSSGANSPPHGHSLPVRTPRIDGKEFFRRVRSHLSYEQFSAFLANIKELNAQKQTREETLRKAEEIFGTDNKDLFLSFQGLLNRNIY